MIERTSIIDHDREEPPRDTSKSPWLAAFVVLGFGWVLHFILRDPDWATIGLAFASGGAMTAWAIEYTGNKVPASWRRKPSSARRP